MSDYILDGVIFPNEKPDRKSLLEKTLKKLEEMEEFKVDTEFEIEN